MIIKTNEADYRVEDIIYFSINSLLVKARRKKGSKYEKILYVLKFYKNIGSEETSQKRLAGNFQSNFDDNTSNQRLEFERNISIDMFNDIQCTNKNNHINVVVPIRDILVVQNVIFKSKNEFEYSIDNFKEYIYPGKVVALMDYMGDGLFVAQMLKKNSLSTLDKVNLTIKILEAASIIHDTGFFHLDIHPGNVYVMRNQNEFIVQFIDFGNSIHESQIKKKKYWLFTPGYSHPLLLKNNKKKGMKSETISEDMDLYSIMSIFHNMLYGNCITEHVTCGILPNTYHNTQEAILYPMKDIFDSFFKNIYEESLNLKYSKKGKTYYREFLFKYLDLFKREIISLNDYDIYTYLQYRYSESKKTSFTKRFAENLLKYCESLKIDDFYKWSKLLYQKLRSDDPNYYMSSYIFECLYYIFSNLKFADNSKDFVYTEYRLLKCGLICYSRKNVTGKINEIKERIDELQKLNNTIRLEETDIINDCIYQANHFIDRIEYKEAYDALYKYKRNISKLKNINWFELNQEVGRFYSGIAYSESFYRINKEKTIRKGVPINIYNHFIQSLNYFDGINDNGNSEITKIHFIQTAIAYGDYDCFHKIIGDEDIICTIPNILKSGIVNSYRILAYLKAIYIFTFESINDIYINSTNHIDFSLVDGRKHVNFDINHFDTKVLRYTLTELYNYLKNKPKYIHPDQLLYKFIGLILFSLNKNEDLKDKEIIEDCLFLSYDLCNCFINLAKFETTNKYTNKQLKSADDFLVYKNMYNQNKALKTLLLNPEKLEDVIRDYIIEYKDYTYDSISMKGLYSYLRDMIGLCVYEYC